MNASHKRNQLRTHDYSSLGAHSIRICRSPQPGPARKVRRARGEVALVRQAKGAQHIGPPLGRLLSHFLLQIAAGRLVVFQDLLTGLDVARGDDRAAELVLL